MVKKFVLTAILPVLLLATTFVAAQKNNSANLAEVKAVSTVDLKRYSGKWFEIARYSNKSQKNCIGNTTIAYTLKTDGNINVLSECLKKDGTMIDAKGEAKIVDKSSNAKLEVRYAPGFLAFLSTSWNDYWIIDLDEKYQYAAVGDEDRDNLWILSRTPKLNDAAYQNILRRVEAMGFKPGKLIKTPQNVEVVKGAVIEKQ
ncbi:MAG TPA: lipocalin family protein [Pyrinomonadaceae bacterium]|jgi:apolipoprotein D and lipocalin family protein